MARWSLAHVNSVNFDKGAFGVAGGTDWARYQVYGESVEAKGYQKLDVHKVEEFITHLLDDGWEPLTFSRDSGPGSVVGSKSVEQI